MTLFRNTVLVLSATLVLVACKNEEPYPFSLAMVKSNSCGIETANSDYTVSVLDEAGEELTRLVPDASGKVTHEFKEEVQTILVVEDLGILKQFTKLKDIRVSDLGVWHSRYSDITGCECDSFDMDIFPGNLTNNHINFPHSPSVTSAQKISYEAARICQPVGEDKSLLVAFANIEEGLHYYLDENPLQSLQDDKLSINIVPNENLISPITVNLPEGMNRGRFNYVSDDRFGFYAEFNNLTGANMLRHERVKPTGFQVQYQLTSSPFLIWQVYKPLASTTDHLEITAPEGDTDQLLRLLNGETKNYDFSADSNQDMFVQYANFFFDGQHERWQILSGVQGSLEESFDLPGDLGAGRPDNIPSHIRYAGMDIYDLHDRSGPGVFDTAEAIKLVAGKRSTKEPLEEPLSVISYSY